MLFIGYSVASFLAQEKKLKIIVVLHVQQAEAYLVVPASLVRVKQELVLLFQYLLS